MSDIKQAIFDQLNSVGNTADGTVEQLEAHVTTLQESFASLAELLIDSKVIEVGDLHDIIPYSGEPYITSELEAMRAEEEQRLHERQVILKQCTQYLKGLYGTPYHLEAVLLSYVDHYYCATEGMPAMLFDKIIDVNYMQSGSFRVSLQAENDASVTEIVSIDFKSLITFYAAYCVENTFTDYPIKRFGDKAGEAAPQRPCLVIGYDSDKYCHILVWESERKTFSYASIKSGYVYTRDDEGAIVPISKDLNNC